MTSGRSKGRTARPGRVNDVVRTARPGRVNDVVPATRLVALGGALCLLLAGGCGDEPVPSIALSETSLTFGAVEGFGDPAAQIVHVTNSGDGTLAVPTTSIRYETGSGWLSASVAGSAEPYTITVEVTTGALSPGRYEAYVVVDCSGAGTSEEIAVRFDVAPQAAPEITSTPQTTVAVGLLYRYEVAAAGSPAPTVTAADLPGWLSFDEATHTIYGVPGPAAVGQTGPISVTAANGVGSDDTQSFALTVVRSSGSVWTWGYNSSGQLGDGTRYSRATAGPVQGLADVVAIVARAGRSRAVKADGTVWAWGDDLAGQSSGGANGPLLEPVRVQELSDVVAVDGGREHALALKVDGTVWAWGYNWAGQLGDGTTEPCSAPVQAHGLTSVLGLAGKAGHSHALKADGTVWSWGENEAGQLGDGTLEWRATPVKVQGLTDVVAVAAGGFHCLAVRTDGTVWSWGANWEGQLGDGTTEPRLTPVQVQGTTGAVAIAGGAFHSLALKADGTAWAWGDNWAGQLGDGTTESRWTPVQVLSGHGGLTDVVAVATGKYHSLALRADGTVWACGENGMGQLGDGSIESRFTPVKVVGLTGALAISGGMAHSIALKAD